MNAHTCIIYYPNELIFRCEDVIRLKLNEYRYLTTKCNNSKNYNKNYIK